MPPIPPDCLRVKVRVTCCSRDLLFVSIQTAVCFNMATALIVVVTGLICVVLRGEATDPVEHTSTATRMASLEARLVLLDIRQNTLESQTSALRTAVAAMQGVNVSLQDGLRALQEQRQNQTDMVDEVRNENEALAREVLAFKVQLGREQAAARNTSSHFHVRMAAADPAHPAPNTPLLMTNVRDNEGHGYDPRTGKFTAPVSGTYCILASAAASVKHASAAGALLMVDGVEMDRMNTMSRNGDHQNMAMQAVVQLNAGQRVWVQVSAGSYFWYGPTSFSGFLVHAD